MKCRLTKVPGGVLPTTRKSLRGNSTSEPTDGAIECLEANLEIWAFQIVGHIWHETASSPKRGSAKCRPKCFPSHTHS